MVLVLGSFVGGEVELPGLHVYLSCRHGNIYLIRGRVVPHAVRRFTGERFSWIFFMHQNMIVPVQGVNQLPPFWLNFPPVERPIASLADRVRCLRELKGKNKEVHG